MVSGRITSTVPANVSTACSRGARSAQASATVVADPSRNPPVLKNPSALAETGRGLHLVGAFSDSWGYAALGDRGKAVWAMFSTGPQPAATGSGGPG